MRVILHWFANLLGLNKFNPVTEELTEVSQNGKLTPEQLAYITTTIISVSYFVDAVQFCGVVLRKPAAYWVLNRINSLRKSYYSTRADVYEVVASILIKDAVERAKKDPDTDVN